MFNDYSTKTIKIDNPSQNSKLTSLIDDKDIVNVKSITFNFFFMFPPSCMKKAPCFHDADFRMFCFMRIRCRSDNCQRRRTHTRPTHR